MKSIAIIPARGGSKRIPRKNIKNFLGKPIIAYTIQACIESKVFDEVMVSTDDEEIANIAKQFGASVPFMRSAKTSDDYATTFDVLDEVINTYKERGKNFDILCCVYPCSPLLNEQMLNSAFSQMGKNEADATISVCRYPVPIEWAMKVENNTLVPNDRQAQNIRSQDLGEKYYDAGMFYICKIDAMYEHKSLVPSNVIPYIIDSMKVQDIDNEEDWKMAEIKYKMLKNNHKKGVKK